VKKKKTRCEAKLTTPKYVIWFSFIQHARYSKFNM